MVVSTSYMDEVTYSCLSFQSVENEHSWAFPTQHSLEKVFNSRSRLLIQMDISQTIGLHY